MGAASASGMFAWVLILFVGFKSASSMGETEAYRQIEIRVQITPNSPTTQCGSIPREESNTSSVFSLDNPAGLRARTEV